MSNLLHLWFVLESQELKIYKDETVSFFFVKFYLQQFKKSIYFLLQLLICFICFIKMFLTTLNPITSYPTISNLIVSNSISKNFQFLDLFSLKAIKKQSLQNSSYVIVQFVFLQNKSLCQIVLLKYIVKISFN